MPSTSPARTVRSTPSTARIRRSSSTTRPATSSTGRPGRGRRPCPRSSLTLRPTISAASSSSAARPAAAVPTVRPRRITVIRSAMALTSPSLWVMKTIDLPAALSDAHDREQFLGLLRGEHRGRLVQDQQVDVAGERLDDLDPLLDADRQVLDHRVRVDRQAVPLGDLGDLAAGPPPVEEAGDAAADLLGAEHDVLGDGEDRHQHEVLVHHADAGGDGVRAGRVKLQRLAVDQDLALVGLVEPVEHVHQGRLAGAVLAEQGVDLSRLHRQVDVVVGDQITEPLGDAAQFESQRNLLECGRWCSVVPVDRSPRCRRSVADRPLRRRGSPASPERPVASLVPPAGAPDDLTAAADGRSLRLGGRGRP